MTSIASKRKLLVSDLMATTVHTLPPTATVREAASIMRDHNIGDVLVVEEDGSLSGILTDRDIAIRSVALGRNPEDMTVREACTTTPTWIRPDVHALDALNKMRTEAVHRLPVLDSGRIVGIVSLGDLVLKLEDRTALAGIFSGQHAGDAPA